MQFFDFSEKQIRFHISSCCFYSGFKIYEDFPFSLSMGPFYFLYIIFYSFISQPPSFSYRCCNEKFMLNRIKHKKLWDFLKIYSGVLDLSIYFFDKRFYANLKNMKFQFRIFYTFFEILIKIILNKLLQIIFTNLAIFHNTFSLLWNCHWNILSN